MSLSMAADLKKIADALENIHERLKELLKHLQEEPIHVVEGF